MGMNDVTMVMMMAVIMMVMKEMLLMIRVMVNIYDVNACTVLS